jgi:hypothetical protein
VGIGAFGGTLAAGTVITTLHCGHEAFLPAAATGTFNIRPQPLQRNSIFVSGGPMGVFMP